MPRQSRQVSQIFNWGCMTCRCPGSLPISVNTPSFTVNHSQYDNNQGSLQRYISINRFRLRHIDVPNWSTTILPFVSSHNYSDLSTTSSGLILAETPSPVSSWLNLHIFSNYDTINNIMEDLDHKLIELRPRYFALTWELLAPIKSTVGHKW